MRPVSPLGTLTIAKIDTITAATIVMGTTISLIGEVKAATTRRASWGGSHETKSTPVGYSWGRPSPEAGRNIVCSDL